MDKQKEYLLNNATDRINSILEELYAGMSDYPFSMDVLADALGQQLPWLSREQLLANLQMLKKGIESGYDEFERLYNLPREALDGEIERQLLGYLEPMADSEQRQFLLLLCQVLYQDTGFKIDSNLSIYMANMPTGDIKQEVCLLLEEKGKEIVGDTSAFLSESQEKFLHSKGALRRNYFTEEENDLITAAAVFASMQKSGLKVVHAEQIGKQIGIQKSFLQRFGEIMRDKVLPATVQLLAIAAVAVAVYSIVEVLVYTEALAFVTTFISENHMWKIALPAALSVLAAGCNWLSRTFQSAPVTCRIQSEAVEAKSRLQRHFDQTRIQADRFADRLIPEYTVIDENEFEDYTVDDSREEVIFVP